MDIQSLYQKALKFGASKHVEQDQKIPGTDLPYVVHLSNVAMEILVAGSFTEGFDIGFAVQVALLHDTLEDTPTEFSELQLEFGKQVADAVLALSKNEQLPKGQQMPDCLHRIKQLQPEVWAVKMADRITNLQPPPAHWDSNKRKLYKKEATLIHAALAGGNAYLAERLEMKIKDYQ